MFTKLADDTKLVKTTGRWKKEWRIILHWLIHEVI
ncbi:hypothetical protein Nmel_009945 [Mimus melanotis]